MYVIVSNDWKSVEYSKEFNEAFEKLLEEAENPSRADQETVNRPTTFRWWA